MPSKNPPKMIKTATPGVFKRGARYVVTYYADGKQHKESAPNYKRACKLKASRETQVDTGEFHADSRITLHAYLRDWLPRYRGRGRRGFRPATRVEYGRQLDTYVYPCPVLPAKLPLSRVTPKLLADWVAWLCQQTYPAPTKDDKDRRVPLSDATVRRITAPLRAALATAVREGLIRHNPAAELDLPYRSAEDWDKQEAEQQVKAMDTEQLQLMLGLVPAEWLTFFRFLAATGLRISEAVGLQWRHLQLDGSDPYVQVRRAIVKGVVGPPKSRHGCRDVPLDHGLVVALREAYESAGRPAEDAPVFAAGNGAPLTPENVFRRVLQPAREEACLTWVGFHTFRHTCATMLFAEGRNAKQVQRWLGHHSPSFTIDTYVHLLGDDLGGPLTVPAARSAVTAAAVPSPVPAVAAA